MDPAIKFDNGISSRMIIRDAAVNNKPNFLKITRQLEQEIFPSIGPLAPQVSEQRFWRTQTLHSQTMPFAELKRRGHSGGKNATRSQSPPFHGRKANQQEA